MLLRHLDRHAAELGPRPCLIHWQAESYNVLTYAQFAELSNRLAAAIKSRATAGPAGVVFVIVKHRLMQLPLFVGCMRAGFIPSFLPFPSAKQDPDLYWQSHAEVIERTRPAAIVTYDDLMDGVAAIAAQ
jgi:acyl-coenzyme A synthetase/AMP-(fatty) acid ligase